MTQEQAKKIAKEYGIQFPTRPNIHYIGMMNEAFCFSYRKMEEKEGHRGRPIYAIVDNVGRWKLLEEDIDITNAILLSCEVSQRNS